MLHTTMLDDIGPTCLPRSDKRRPRLRLVVLTDLELPTINTVKLKND